MLIVAGKSVTLKTSNYRKQIFQYLRQQQLAHLDDNALLDTKTLVLGLGKLHARSSFGLLRPLCLCLVLFLDCLLLACGYGSQLLQVNQPESTKPTRDKQPFHTLKTHVSSQKRAGSVGCFCCSSWTWFSFHGSLVRVQKCPAQTGTPLASLQAAEPSLLVLSRCSLLRVASMYAAFVAAAA